MIKKYIKDLHKKPEPHRRRVAYISSGVITLLIALVWVTSFGYLHPLNPPVETVAVETTEVKGPFSTLGANVSNGYNAIRGAFGLETSDNAGEKRNATPTLEYIPD